LSGILAHEEAHQFADVLGGAEGARWLLLLHESAGGLLDGDVVALGDDFNLPLDEGREDEAGTDGVDSHALLGVLERDGLGEADDAVLGRHVGGLVDGGDQSVDGGDVDDSAPASLLHEGEGVLGEVEGRAEVQRDDLLPLGVGEVGHLVDVLHACVVHQHVHASEVLQGLIHDLLAVGSLRQVGEDELGLHTWVLLREISLSVLDLLI
jgi:hypothetical protein